MGDLGLSDLRPSVQGVVLTKEAFLMFGHAAWLLARASLAPVIISFALLCKRPVQKFKPFSGHYTNLFYLQTCLFIPEVCREKSSGSAVLITQAKNSSFIHRMCSASMFCHLIRLIIFTYCTAFTPKSLTS